MGDRRLGFVSVSRSDAGHLSPLLALLPDARVYRWASQRINEPFEIAVAAGQAVINFAHQFRYDRPDLLVVFGDRWEQQAAATAALMQNIPIVHLHAGERTEAVLDDACREAISAMATIHVAAAEPYAARLAMMGYRRVHCLGAPGLARMESPLPSHGDAGLPRILVAFHPETRNLADVERQAGELKTALDEWDPCGIVVTAPGMDSGRDTVIGALSGYESAVFSDDQWLIMLRTADVLVGNSSCGIIETPSIPLPSVNIGDRQTGRLLASSVIQVAHDRHAIRAGIALALNPEWRTRHLTGENPYGDRHAAERIAELLTTCAL